MKVVKVKETLTNQLVNNVWGTVVDEQSSSIQTDDGKEVGSILANPKALSISVNADIDMSIVVSAIETLLANIEVPAITPVESV